MPISTPDVAVERTDKPLRMIKRIGSTTYKVSVYFSRTSKETMGDKIIRMIEKDMVKP